MGKIMYKQFAVKISINRVKEEVCGLHIHLHIYKQKT